MPNQTGSRGKPSQTTLPRGALMGPATFVNVYGAKSPIYIGVVNGIDRIYHCGLEDSFAYGHVILWNISHQNDRTFPTDLALQSIVHVKVGILPRGQQARVTFFFSLPPNVTNTVQIFVNDALGQRLDSEFNTPPSPVYAGSRTALVTGDGRTSIDVYFRPIRGDWPNNCLLFDGAEVVLI